MKVFNMPIGQYYPGDSLAHRLDPRVKIIFVLLFVVSLLVIRNFVGFVLVFLFLVGIVFFSRLPRNWIIKGLRPLRYILIITFLMHALFTYSGRILFSLGPLTIVDQGLINGFITSFRLILLVLGTSLLTLTTTPIELTDGIEYLLSPLKALKLPAHELAMMMTIALRFIPILLMETERIMKAQMTRGADFESGNLVRRAKSFVPLFIPLFVGIFRRADELALAMESRCYRGGENRTRMRSLEIKMIDVMTIVLLVFVLIALSILGRL
jgi:energy-coupling factor transport system permease protein